MKWGILELIRQNADSVNEAINLFTLSDPIMLMYNCIAELGEMFHNCGITRPELQPMHMCHFGLSLPISLKPVGGITSH